MNRENIEKLILDINSIAEKHTNDEFNVAMYIYMRIGMFNFINYINETELEQIDKEIQKHETLFNENLNYEIDKIVDEEE